MMRKVISVLLAVLMLACVFPVAAHADGLASSGTMGVLKWTFNSATGALKITGMGMMPSYSSPENSPFYRCNEIKTVEIGEGVTRVGSYAFYQCLLLNRVDLPSTIHVIGKGAFAGNSSLKTIDLPLSLETIGEQAFAASGLANVTIPKNVTAIDSYAFSQCKSLAWISVLGDGSKYASDKYGVLYGCTDGVKTSLLQFPIGRGETAYIIPDTVTEIGRDAFREDPKLQVVLIPSSVTSIGSYAFMNCTSLSTVGMGSGVKSIGTGAFRGCTKLWDVYVEGGESFYDTLTVASQNEPLQDSNPINDCGFGPCGDRVMYFYDGIEKKIKILGEGKMTDYDYDMNPSDFGYYDPVSAYIGPYVTSVSDYAFWNCDELLLISVDSENTKYEAVDGVLFSADGTRLCAYPSAVMDGTYTVPDGVTEIAPGAFGETCDNLKKVVLPKSLKTVGYGAFENCDNLANVTYRGGSLAWGSITIEDANDPLTNADRKYIADTLNITIPEPKAGETPITSIKTLPAAEKFSPYSSYTLRWTPNDETFKSGTAYTVTVTAELKSNYVLPDDPAEVTATINGNPATVAFDWISLAGHKTWFLKVTYTFPATGSSVMLGDVDDDKHITASDARLVLRRAVDLETFAPGSREYVACDVDKDGSVTANDARSILRAAVELEDPATW